MNLCRLRTFPVLALVALLSACGKGQSAKSGHQGSMPPPQVDVVVAHSKNVELTRTVVGRLAATKVAEVRARVTGIVLKRTYKEGSQVKQGQQLFQIDPAPLKATLNLREAELAQARASAENARQTAHRDRKLHAKGLLSPQQLDNALANQRTTAAAVKQAEANVELAKLDLGYAKVTAPISGLAEEAQVTEGALVNQSSGTIMTTVQQIDPLYINFTLPAASAARLRAASAGDAADKTPAGTIDLSFRDGTDYPQKGRLDYLGSSVDPNTGNVSIRGIVPNPGQRLLPGMFVNVRVVTGTLGNAFVLPQAAVQRDGKGAYVLTVNDGKVSQTRVDTHQLEGSDWVVTGDLKDGTQVIVSGVQKTHPGGTVKPQLMKAQNDKSGAASASAS